MKHELQTFLGNAIAKLSSDTRILGVAVAGSWITQTTDDYSELDLVIVIDNLFYIQTLKERYSFAERLGQILSVFPGDHLGEPHKLLICLYGNPLIQVNLKFLKLSDLEQRIENPVVVWERDGILTQKMSESISQHPMPRLQWIEDRFWVWIHYAAAKLGRGELFEVIDFLSFLRSQVLGPLASVKNKQLPRGSRKLEAVSPEDFSDLQKTVASYNRQSCADAIYASILLYQKLRIDISEDQLIKLEEAEKATIKYLNKIVREDGNVGHRH
ncbi:MAG: aminoglycoside 6-adenylyltransferase [Bdellovibrionaceae bacterium]|nr:aminoglycoside 6-adenylyltransferase [Pseudobdellovibrionaceae bacterium]